MLIYKTNKVDWLDQVEDAWDKFLFQEAINWKTKEIPAELKTKFSDKLEGEVRPNKKLWFNLMLEMSGWGMTRWRMLTQFCSHTAP
jgi:hypothetical protein